MLEGTRFQSPQREGFRGSLAHAREARPAEAHPARVARAMDGGQQEPMIGFLAQEQDLTLETQETRKQMRRKRFQRGSLTCRKRKGKVYWYAQWREDGKPKSKELGLCSAITQGKAEAMLAEILEPINKAAGERPEITYTFGRFVEGVYLPVYREQWKASTRMTEEHRLQVHLVKPLGTSAIENITREELQALLTAKANNLSRSCVDHLRFRLRSIFELALSEGVVDRNPATTLYSPKRCRPGRERKVLTQAQAALMEEVLDLRERVMARLATWEGMRPGEILALQVGDIGADAIAVRRRLYRGDIDVPKTTRSIREVALTNRTTELLKVLVEGLWGSLPPSDAWVFPAANLRSPAWRDNIWYRYMRPRLKKVGLEWATFQVMRRTFATWSKRAGIDAHTRSAQMGNTVDVNENEYAVSSLEDRLAAVRKLEKTVIH